MIGRARWGAWVFGNGGDCLRRRLTDRPKGENEQERDRDGRGTEESEKRRERERGKRCGDRIRIG